MKLGVLIVGIGGATSSTLVSGLMGQPAEAGSLRAGSLWCAIAGDLPKEIYDMSLSGWDYRFRMVNDSIAHHGLMPRKGQDIPIMKAIVGTADYAARVEGVAPTHKSLREAVDDVRRCISNFRLTQQVDKVVVINTSSPMYCGDGENVGWDSATAYSLGAVVEGADWVEFTPSDSITQELMALAQKSGSRLAGRDGSTGQTLLKLALKDFFLKRNMPIDGWYSTNLIGNRDGEVLAHSEYNTTKLRDKTAIFEEKLVGGKEHIVRIEYFIPSGDNKEAWDCVHFRGWLDRPMSLRINWHGADSFLASALLLDIIASLIHADRLDHEAGLLSDIGIFFKCPIGCEDVTFEKLYSRFRRFALTPKEE